MTPEILAKLASLERKASPAPWEADQHDQRDAETVYVAVHGADGKPLFDTCNSESMLIHDESDEDGPHYWDATGKANLEFVAAIRNHAVDLLEIARLASHTTLLTEAVIKLCRGGECDCDAPDEEGPKEPCPRCVGLAAIFEATGKWRDDL